MRRLFRAWSSKRRRTLSRAALHSVGRMHAILERERMRAERGAGQFSLLTLSSPQFDDSADLEQLSQVLTERLREIDEAGLLGPGRVGIVLPETPAAGAWKLCDDICERLPESIAQPQCDVFTMAPDSDRADQNSKPDLEQDDRGASRLDEDSSEDRAARPMQTLFSQPLPGWKRAVDIVGAVVVLTLTAPLLIITTVAIKLTSRGPVFFTQLRHTLGGRPFTIYKFRTMCVEAEGQKASLRKYSEQDGPAFKMANDPRITRLGRFLRKTSIDELPQLFNVLKGDMSLVGPRPLPCDESNACADWQRRRLDVTPGLTCIWQIRGRSAVSFADWARMDVEYIRSRSLLNDLKLIVETVPAVVLRKGAC